MNCEAFENQIDLFAAGEVDAVTAAALERHAAQCSACADRVQAARRRQTALERALEPFRAAEDFTARTMARVRREPERPAKPLIPTIQHPALRLAALAASIALFALAGYGWLRGSPSARVVRGPIARVSRTTASLAPRAALSDGDVVATPRSAKSPALVDLAGGRLRVAVKPASVVRITDPRCGTVAHLARGGLVIGARRAGGCTAVTTPLARVTALGGAVSVQVVPASEESEESEKSGEGGFRGLVTMRVHKGQARVQLASRRGHTAVLRSGQTLVLRSGQRRRAQVQPLPHDEIRRRLAEQRDQVEQRLAHLRRQWEDVSRMVRFAPPEEQAQLFVEGVRFQAQMQQALAIRRAIDRRLGLLDRIEQDPEILAALRGAR
ncbi:MAG: anti-sigma factor family protein [Planctomycetota bacterium]